ncbi:MAG: hypothetical protein CM15mP77_2030 [Synechococcus sp.]|nr:MAG: hypothetical protein CM15mP77_2030 [Synechococcus sp.]
MPMKALWRDAVRLRPFQTRSRTQITQRHGDLSTTVVDMAFVHRPGHVGQCGDVLKRILLPIPALQQSKANTPWIEIRA